MPGEEALASSRRPDQQQVVGPGGGDRQRSLATLETDHLGKFWSRCGIDIDRFGHRSTARFTTQHRQCVLQVLDPVANLSATQQTLPEIVHRQHDLLEAVLDQSVDQADRARYPSQGSVEGEFSEGSASPQVVPLDLAAGGEDPEGDGKIEDRPILFEAGRGEIDDDAALPRVTKAGVLDGGADPLAGFPDPLAWKPTDDKTAKASDQIDLDLDGATVNSIQVRGYKSEHGETFHR